MVERDNIIEVVDIICDDIIRLVINESEPIEGEVYYEDASVLDFLTPYQLSHVMKTIINRYKLNEEMFMNIGAINLPIRYLACYILLHGEIR